MGSSDVRLTLKQFLFASFNHVGFRLVKGKNLDDIICEGSVIHICRQAGRRDQQTFLHTFLPKEKVLAVSCITPATDNSGRDTSHNWTILLDTRQLEDALRSLLTRGIPLSPPKELPEITVKLEIT